MLDKMKEMVRKKDLCVLATAAGNTPHCSLMAYVTDPDCREIYMATQKNTLKYRNLVANPPVSLLIDTRDEHPADDRPFKKALTVDGVFHQIDDPAGEASARGNLLERHPHLKAFLDRPETEVFAIRITSFLLLDGIMKSHYEEI